MFIKTLTGMVLSLASVSLFANEDFLAPDQAFKFQASSISTQKAELNWQIAPHYYLYHEQFKVSVGQKPVALKLPKGEEKDDPTFGKTNVHYHQVTAQIAVQPNSKYQVEWQGCSADGLCYPLQSTTIETDATGLLPQQNFAKKLVTAAEPTLTEEKNQLTQNKDVENSLNTEKQIKTIPEVDNKTTEKPIDSAHELGNASTAQALELIPEEQPKTTSAQTATATQLQPEWNNDQFFLALLSQQNIFFNILIFIGLGILLAFLPCSLPLIPILSGILIQHSKGYRAAAIATTFVLCMALVYGLMGVVVSQLGFGLQRWFQNPIFIGVFALLFVVFALNLFGLYQLSLPQGLMQRLDRLQQRQKGGTLVGAGMMGSISALIVGPCMSAPLAGALLYVSHLDQPLLSGFYLFLLGIGIGLPLFIASVFGAKYLPKPGLWMDRLKFGFGFVMLAMAIYFARPLLPLTAYSVAFVILFLAALIYLLNILRHITKFSYKIIVLILVAVMAVATIWQMNQVYQNINATENTTLHSWIKVTTKQELTQALAQNSQKNVVIDVYADWCVACQPIEREVLPRADVQDALTDVVRIKLDLTQSNASQSELLKEWQILGPPTMIFLNAQQQEVRDLRLTGTFKAAELQQQLKTLTEGTK